MTKNFDRKWWCHSLDEMKHGLNKSRKIIAQSNFSKYSIQSWWNEESEERLWFEGLSSWRKLTVYFYLYSFQEERESFSNHWWQHWLSFWFRRTWFWYHGFRFCYLIRIFCRIILRNYLYRIGKERLYPRFWRDWSYMIIIHRKNC